MRTRDYERVLRNLSESLRPPLRDLEKPAIHTHETMGAMPTSFHPRLMHEVGGYLCFKETAGVFPPHVELCSSSP